MDTALEAQWRERVAKVLKGAPFDTLVSRSPDGIAVQPLYAKADGERERALRQEPARPWRIAQRVDHPDAHLAADLAEADLMGGADALRIVFEGAASARGFGLHADGVAAALERVELDLVRLSLDLPLASAGALAGVDALLDIVRRKRLVPAALDVEFGLDPVTMLAGSGEREAELRQAVLSRVKALGEAGFAGPVLRADGRIHHDAGATSTEELAAILSAATAYLRMQESAGIPLEAAASNIAFLLVADQDQFWTIAKFRSLRRLWGAVQRACGLTPKPARVDAETSFRMCARRDPAVNYLRATTAAFAASVGGADSITILPYTIALGLPDGFARRMARNAQAILIEESHLAQVNDPGAGSGAVEALTDALSESAWILFQEIEAAGGIEAMLVDGRWQARLREAAAARRAAVSAGEAPILGVTLYPDARERPAAVLMPAPQEARRHASALVAVRDAAAFEEETAAGENDKGEVA